MAVDGDHGSRTPKAGLAVKGLREIVSGANLEEVLHLILLRRHSIVEVEIVDLYVVFLESEFFVKALVESEKTTDSQLRQNRGDFLWSIYGKGLNGVHVL